MIKRFFLYIFKRDVQNEDLINNINKYDNDRRKEKNKMGNI